MLIIEVAFPSGRCCTANFDAPDQPEWPPHPSRLFSALVASACQGAGLTEAKRAALEWLEQQPPPLIAAPRADTSAAPTNYVPPGDFNRQQGKVEDPFHRLRKDRFFPAAYLLGEPVVRYVWPQAPDVECLVTLDEVAAGVSHVGTSHSMAVLSAVAGELPASPAYAPDRKGKHFFRVPTAGRVNELIRNYQIDLGVRRPPQENEVLVAYRTSEATKEIAASPFDEFLVVQMRGLTHTAESSEALARAVRRSVMSRIPDPIPVAIHGHVDGLHIGWIPLCDVGHPNARGRILGLGMAIPAGLKIAERQALFAAIEKLRESGIHLDDGRDVVIESLRLEYQPPVTLDRSTFMQPSRVWATVTPVVPDRLPKNQSSEAAAASLAQSLVRAGFPEPEEIAVSRYSVFQGAPAAPVYRLRLPRYHAVVRFPVDVAGPVLAGRLRYFGIGLLRPYGGSPC
jgi:CRISPR-associated protein Csb2